MTLDLVIALLVVCCFLSVCVEAAPAATPPHGLMVDLLAQPETTVIQDGTPEFSWIVGSTKRDEVQTAYRILVASSHKKLDADDGDLWDSGEVKSGASVSVPYSGSPLSPGQKCFWKVKTWCQHDGESAWSTAQSFCMADKLVEGATSRYSLERTLIEPVKITEKSAGHYFVDFGKVAFGFLQLELESPVDDREIAVHLAERGDTNGVNRSPGGTVRYYEVKTVLKKGKKKYDIHPPRDKRNTGGKAVRLPNHLGTITPFRYVELVNCPVKITADSVRQVAIHYPFDEQASSFNSSSKTLNDIWALCKYSMKATSFCGVYVDGDRERIPYEADAYINQLSHYAVDREFSLARYSHEYLMANPTWPTEWKQHSVLMAWADYMYTGDRESLEKCYDQLRAEKTLEKRARKDGLLDTKGMRDIVDWPHGERDKYDFRDVNTVVNAFYYKTLTQMVDIAEALGKDVDASEYRREAARVKKVFNQKLFDPERGVYIDGEGSRHASLHANMMPLAFGLVPPERVEKVADFVVSRDMACSVYGAQYLLESLYEGGRPEVGLERMVSRKVRSWYNMLRVGSTITLEAWDNRFKPNQDWNHAWGAAPGNIIARYVLGVQPLEPGFACARIRPMPGGLKYASGTVPTIRGPITVEFRQREDGAFDLDVALPANMTARVELPMAKKASAVELDGKTVPVKMVDGFGFVEAVGSGHHVFKVR